MEPQAGAAFNFTLEVAGLLEGSDLGSVKVSAPLDGFEIDILIERGQRRGRHRIVVECKAYTKLVGSRTIHAFVTMVDYLRETGAADEAWLVTLSGFTANARLAAEKSKIRLYTIGELRERFDRREPVSRPQLDRLKADAEARSRSQKRLFVIMPFRREFDDVYILGIRWAAAKHGVIVQRADDFKHMGDIVGEIKRAIQDYNGVIGDTTGANPNVCYEVGFAHALGRPTILICRSSNELPFDLRGVNHVMYESVVELRPKLLAMLRAVLP